MKAYLLLFFLLTTFYCTAQDTIKVNELKIIEWYNKADGTTCTINVLKKDSSLFSGVVIEPYGINKYLKIERYKKGNMSHYTSFYPNGNVFISQSFDSTETCFKLDSTTTSHRPCGLAYEYYENGILHIRQNFDHGIPVGTWIYYDDKGNTIKKERYSKKGKLLKTKTYK